ncbi:MAG: discoidin domain-containing protein, partial [Phycisphaerales bacterium]
IQYEFDKAYKLYEMWVWNHNTVFEGYLGFGFKDVTIEYSSNGTNWTQLGGVTEFARAPGEGDYEHSNTIDFDGIVARYVKLTANSNWVGLPQSGLSEIRFLYLPVRARGPNPADEQEDVSPDTVLSWKAGREAVTHEVYLSSDEQAVTEGTVTPVTRAEATYDPLPLDLDKTYYWKVAEVNNSEEPKVWESEVWSFTTSDSLVVDDMESYGDGAVIGQPGSNLWYTWKDGEGWVLPEPSYGGNGTGSVVEISKDPAIDGQSLTFYYDNDGTNFIGSSGKQYYSEVTAAISDLSIGADWTQSGIRALSLQFYGDPGNDAGATEQMYVKLNGVRIPYDGDMSDIQEAWWHEWNVDLASFGVGLQNITEISVGFGSGTNTTAQGGSGVVYVDNLRLYPSRCVAEYGPAGDITGDCVADNEDFTALANQWHMPQLAVEYTFTTGLSDTSGNNRHGIAQNSPVVSGGVLTLDGTNFVDIPLGADNPFDGSQDFSIVMDFQSKVPSILISSAREPFEPMGDGEPGTYSGTHAMSVYVHRWDEPYWGEVIYDNFFVTATTAEDDPLDGEWHTMVVTYDADGGWNDELEQPTGWATVYLDGVSGDGTDMDPNIPNIAADTVRIGGSLNAEFPYSEDADNLSGAIDNVRIYNFALSQEDVRSLPAVPFGPADLNTDGVVDFKDFAILVSMWAEQKHWP